MMNKIEEVIKDLKKGKMVIVVDDEDRENEGDFILPAQFASKDNINFMLKFGRGLICVPMEAERLDQLQLYPLRSATLDRDNVDPYYTDWAMSVDARAGTTTGISAKDRAQTIKALIDPETRSSDLIRPGHIFPLRAKEGGVLVRAGHTEGCIDLMRAASLYPAGVICEIIKDNGEMARLPDLTKFATGHNLKICSISDLIKYRLKSEKLVKRLTETHLPTKYGRFKLILYESVIDQSHHIALIKGNPTEAALVRVHSQCLTGDVFHSERCDCGRQLEEAMKIIHRAKRGILLYMRQEGRGIGLADKLKAYSLQDGGLDTVEANEALGFKADLRDYGLGAQILVDLGVKKIKLLTNNPQKIVGLEGYGLKVIKRIPLQIASSRSNRKYLKAKKEKLGHLLDI
jgi:3,4-dihydroxy 2-butanone 4-phosphate synthase / GTP cyclohydrolase II